MRKTVFVVIFTLLAIFSGIATSYYIFTLPNNNIIPAYSDNNIHLIYEGILVDEFSEPKIIDNQVIIPFDAIKKYIDEYIWFDSETNKVTITTKNRVIRMKTDSLNAIVNNSPVELNISATFIDGVLYIPIEFLSDFYRIEIKYFNSTNSVVIDSKDTIRQIAYPITNEAVIRKGRSIKYPIIKTFNEDLRVEENKLFVFEEYDKWYKVRTIDGIIGFIDKKDIVITKVYIENLPIAEENNIKPIEGKINMTWQQLYKIPMGYSEQPKKKGLDIVSPTWFQVINENGDLKNRADMGYVDWAHSQGYQVWALVANEFSNIDNTSKLLNNTDARDNFITQLLAYAALYKLDGINIDFENIYKKDKDVLTQFIREVTPLLKEQGLVVTMAVTIPDGSDNWSKCYDREELAKVVDFMCLMTYDQTPKSSKIGGSTSELPWIESNVKKVLNYIPKEKLLLGVAFYTRLWEEQKDEKGNTFFKNTKNYTMGMVENTIKDNNAIVAWNEETAQYVANYEKDGLQYKLWIEDEASVDVKSALVHKYMLAGVCLWSDDFANDVVWEVLERNMKKINSYKEWKDTNEIIKKYN